MPGPSSDSQTRRLSQPPGVTPVPCSRTFCDPLPLLLSRQQHVPTASAQRASWGGPSGSGGAGLVGGRGGAGTCRRQALKPTVLATSSSVPPRGN